MCTFLYENFYIMGGNMKNNEKDKKKNHEIGEDSTQYGEFVSTFFTWKTPKEQKKVVEKLENITKKEEK